MGQSQLLLIVLGVIIVGAAAIIGMNLFHVNAIEANRNGINSDLLSIANQAQGYYKRTSELGGGDRDFSGFQISNQMQTNENGEYTIISLQQNRAVFQGVGVEPLEVGVGCSQSDEYVTHQINVYPDSVQIVQIY